MNNSLIELEPERDSEQLIQEESRLIRIIEAIQEVVSTNGWSTLKAEVFDKLSSSLERELRTEARKDDPDPKRLNRLTGELRWAEKYSDLLKLGETYKLQLRGIRNNNGKSDTPGL